MNDDTSPTMQSTFRPLLPHVRNEAYDQVLREHLRILRDRAPAALARRIDDVLEGRRTLRGLAESHEADNFLMPLVLQGAAAYEQLTADEQAARAAAVHQRFGDLTLRHGGRSAPPG